MRILPNHEWKGECERPLHVVEFEAMKLGSFFCCSAIAAAILTLSAVSIAQDADVAAVVEGRQSNLRDLGAAFKGINDELKKSEPSMPLIKQYATQIDDLAKQQRFWFPAGSGPQPDIKTKAKQQIWTRASDFSQAQSDFVREAGKLREAAAGSDLSALRPQQRVLGKTCEACHKQFREKEDD
jgi:cytochrome c556